MSDWSLLLRLPLTGLVSKAPGWIVGRFYPAKKAEGRFDVDLRSLRGLSVSRTAIPELEIMLRLTNRNPFDVHVYRIDFTDIWFAQPVLTNVQRLVDSKIPANSVVPPLQYQRSTGYGNGRLVFRLQLGKDRLDYIQTQVRDGKLQSDPTIAIDVYARCAVGEFVKKDVYLQVPAHQVGGI